MPVIVARNKVRRPERFFSIALRLLCLPEAMKETAAKRRDKAAGRDSKAEKPKELGPEPQDVEMPEEEAANAARQPSELDAVTLDGKVGNMSVNTARRPVQKAG